MGDSTDSSEEWNCLVKPTMTDTIHAAAVDGRGLVQGIACNTRGSSRWELAQPEHGTSYAACGRCIRVDAFREIPGVAKDSLSSFELDPHLYEPPVESLTRLNR